MYCVVLVSGGEGDTKTRSLNDKGGLKPNTGSVNHCPAHVYAHTGKTQGDQKEGRKEKEVIRVRLNERNQQQHEWIKEAEHRCVNV